MSRALSLLLLLSVTVFFSSLLVSAHFHPNPLSKIHLENIVMKPGAGVIHIDAPMLHGFGENVNISFSGITSPPDNGTTDWIGVWSPKPANYSTVSPSKYKYVKPDSSGSGTVELWLLNMRDSVVVAYFTGGLEHPVLLAESEPVRFEHYELPMHLHMALTGNPREMRIDWTSAQGNEAQPRLRWGEQPANLSHVIYALTSTYTASEMCGAPATTVGYRSPGFLHTVLISELRPHTQYFYQVSDNTPYSESRVLSFWSAPESEAQNVEFVIFGDLGQVEPDGSNEASEMEGSILTTVALARDIEQGVVRLDASAAVFHIGDISYARGYVTLWEQFFSQLSLITPYIPWMTVDGNHERDFPGSGSVWTGEDSGGECGVALAKRFHMPNPQNPQPQDQTWWSVDFGPVHFTVISTEHEFNESTPQYEWFRQDLAAVNRSKTPFLILAGHRPMYIDSTNNDSGGGDLPVGRQLISALEPLMQRYQVDVAFWGHHHSYQRTCPVHNFTCVSETQGTIHIVTGAAGAGFSQNIQTPQPKWINFLNDSTHGYVIAHVRERQTLTLDFINANNRTVMDTVTIKSKFPAVSINEVAAA